MAPLSVIQRYCLVDTAAVGHLRDRRRDLGNLNRGLDHPHHLHERESFPGLTGEGDGRLLELAVNKLKVAAAVEEVAFRERAFDVDRSAVDDDVLLIELLAYYCLFTHMPHS